MAAALLQCGNTTPRSSGAAAADSNINQHIPARGFIALGHASEPSDSIRIL